MSAIQSDAATNDTALNADTASELFLKQWEAAPSAPAKAVEGDKNVSDSMDAENISDDEELLLDENGDPVDPADSEDEGQPENVKLIEDDDAMFKVVVDGEEKMVSAKELKRLAGQEASLTRKSMEVAARRKEAEEIGTYHAQALSQLVKMAEDEYRPYANIDFLVAAKELSAEELKALREEANSKYQKYQYLTSELNTFSQRAAEQRSRLMHEQAQATIQELSDPQKGIPNWGPKLYEEVGNYAISKGMKPEVFTSILDAPSLRMLYDAYRFDRARKVTTTKKAQAPQKVLKSSASPDSGRFGNDKSKASLSKLRQTGSRDDAVSALLSKWGVDS
jgi:hypothetical protein